jgi:methionyl-tRNA formyltransferase
VRVAALAPARLNDYYVRALAPLFADRAIEVVGAVVDNRPPKPAREKLRRELKRGRGGYVAVMAASSLLARRRGGEEDVDTRLHLAAHGAPSLAVQRLYADETVAWLRGLEPDVLVRIGFGIIREPVLSLAPLGVLSYHHGDMRRYRGQPPGFWEVHDGAGEIGVTVQLLSAELDAGRVVCERRLPLPPDAGWAGATSVAYGSTHTMLHDALLRLGDPAFEPAPVPPNELGPVYTMPNGRQWLSTQLRVLRRRARRP